MQLIEPLREGNLYHIYNRGIDSMNIFKEKRNYEFFIEKYIKYCSPVLETYAFVLLKNHFHLIVSVRENAVVIKNEKMKTLHPSKQLAHFFNCYAQSFNKAYKRHGGLFETPFRRKLVKNDEHYTSLIKYIHANPQIHGFIKDYKKWPYSSWKMLAKNQPSFLAKDKLYDWFGNHAEFIKAHGESFTRETPSYTMEEMEK